MIISFTASTVFIKQTKNHTLAVKQCIVLIENIKILIEYQGADVNNIFYQLSKSNNYNLLDFVLPLSEKAEEIALYIKEKQDFKNLDKEDSDNMKGFLSMLGKSDIAGQISNCELYKAFFQNKLDILEKNEKSKCKNISALTIGVGLILSILII